MNRKYQKIAYSLAALIVLTANLAYILNIPDTNYFIQRSQSMKENMTLNNLIAIAIVLILMTYDTFSDSRSKYNTKNKYKNASVIKLYLEKTKQETNFIVFSLMLPLFIYSILSLHINLPKIPLIAIFSFLFSLTLYSQKWIIEYRITSGYFGNNYYEAQKIINFIAREIKNTDFTDKGNPKKILNNEDLLSLEKDYNGIYIGDFKHEQ